MCGDTVNVVNRMESLGDAEKIQASDEAHERLIKKFVLKPRGIILAKGGTKCKPGC